MKKKTVELIHRKFEKDIYDLDYKIRCNKRKINDLAKEQKDLKETKKALYDILRQLNDDKK